MSNPNGKGFRSIVVKGRRFKCPENKNVSVEPPIYNRQLEHFVRRLIAGVLGAIGMLVLDGCGKPVPPERQGYVGEWQHPTMYLLITQDGSVRYKRMKGGATTSIDAPLKGFQGNNFEVGLGPVTTTFVVAKPPHEEGGQWKMVVDGVALTRTNTLESSE